MAERKLRHIRVTILATQGFEQAELIEPRKALAEAGAQTVVSLIGDDLTGFGNPR